MAQFVKALRPFASCDIGDALVKLKYPLGGYLDGISMWSPTRPGTVGLGQSPTIIGEATTVKMVQADDSTSPKTSKHFADNTQRGKIMYISQPEGLKSACFGGLMGTRAKALGAEGVVIDGRFRDIGEMQEMGLSLFSRGQSILGSNTFTRASELDVPVKFRGDLWVNPGDIIVGDQDGVVVVPPSLVNQVAQICHERKEVDAKTMEALQAGESMGETSAKFRK